MKRPLPFYHLDQLPDPKSEPEFYNVAHSRHLKHIALLLMMNQIRKYDPEKMSDESCRSQLAKLSALQEVIDFDLLITQENTQPEEPELPL